MKVFEEIKQLLSNKNPFVCYVKPNETTWNLLVQKTDKITVFSDQPDLYLCLLMKVSNW